MGNNSVVLYDDDFRYAERLSDSQKAKLFTALLKYRFHEEYTNFDDDLTLYILYNQVVEHVSQNEAKYKETCDKKSEAMKKRWHSEKKSIEKDSTLYNTIQEHSTLCDNDKDKDNDNDIDNDYDKDKDTVACGAQKKTKERKNYYNNKNNVPSLLRDEPSYDMASFTQKGLNLKYEPKSPRKKTESGFETLPDS